MGSDRLSSYNYKLYAGYFKFQHAIETCTGWAGLGICFAFDWVNSLQVFSS